MEGLLKPKQVLLGTDLAGVVEAVGKGVDRWMVGDKVFGDVMYHRGRTFAEYASVTQSAPLAAMPEGLTFQDAATLPQSGTLALQGLRRVRETRAGDRVLINGAGGGGGTLAIQLAKAVGAEVTAVDSVRKLEAMSSLGADHVIDFRSGNYTRNHSSYDRILDFVGSRSLSSNRRALASGGVYSVVGGAVRRLLNAGLVGGLLSRLGGKQMSVLMGRPNSDDLAALAEMVVSGEIDPVVHATYPLEETARAIADLGDGLVIGKAVIAIA